MNPDVFPPSPLNVTRHAHMNDYISCLDPLLADKKLESVPALNRKKEIKSLVTMLSDMLPSTEEINDFNYYQSAAAMRDLGFLLGSLKRHLIEPENFVEKLPQKLHLLAKKTNLPPRDTLLHYTVWNPDGSRLRTYTGTEDEKNLIESIKISMHPLNQAIIDVKDLYYTPLETPEFVILCGKIIEELGKMVKAMVHCKKNVSTYFFANELRLYFDPITLNNVAYLGPGAVEMPLFVFDHILWSTDCQEEEYVKFKNTYLPYILPEMRTVFHEFSGEMSLLTKTCATLDAERGFNKNTFHSIKKLKELCMLLKSFRMPHKKMADESYAHSGEGKRQKGSGGYQPDILAYIIKLNWQRIDEFDKSYQNYKLNA